MYEHATNSIAIDLSNPIQIIAVSTTVAVDRHHPKNALKINEKLTNQIQRTVVESEMRFPIFLSNNM